MSAPTHDPARALRAAPSPSSGAPRGVRAAAGGSPRRGLRAPLAHLLVVLAGLLLGLPGLLVAAPARADEPSPAMVVTLSTSTPASPDAKGTLVLTGTVTNTSDQPVHDVQVHLWRSTDELTDRSALDEALASSAENPLGRRMVSVADGNVFNVTDVGSQRSQAFPAGKASFAPGESASFTVRGKVSGADSLGLEPGASYLVGVQVRGVPANGTNQTLGRARSLVVVAPTSTPGQPVERTRAASVVLLNSRPSMVADGVFSDDHLAQELTGRLADLLALAQQPGTTALVDPALVDELTAMAHGYTLVGGGDASQTRAGQQAASRALAVLQRLVAQPGRAYRTPYGSPDVQLAATAGRTDLLTRSVHALPADHLLAGLALAVLPDRGQLDAKGLAAVAALHPSLVLVANLGGSAPVQQAGGLTLVNLVPDAFGGGPGPDPRTTLPQVVGRLQVQQRLAAEPVVTVASTSLQARAEAAAAGWRERLTLPQLVAASTSEQARLTPLTDLPDGSGWFDQADATGREVSVWGDLVGDLAQARSVADQVLPEAISTAWAGDRGAAGSWLAQVRQQRGSVLTSDQVGLHVVSSFVTSASSQEIPVTISNKLSRPVRVRVAFDSENPQRIDVVDSEVHTVAPGDSETVKVRVTTRANGQVGVTARLTTPDGRQVGTPRSLTITATQAGRVGWIIIIASGAVLLAGTAMRIRQVQHERRLSSGTPQTAHLAPGQRRGQ